MWHWWRLSYVSFLGLAGLQDSGMWAAPGNDRDCWKAIALEFCIQTSLLASRKQQTSTDLQSKNTLG